MWRTISSALQIYKRLNKLSTFTKSKRNDTIRVKIHGQVPAALRGINNNLDTRTVAAIAFAQTFIMKERFVDEIMIAENAVAYADALVEALNKKKKSYE